MWEISATGFPFSQALTLHFLLFLLLATSIILGEEAPSCSYLMLELQHIIYGQMQTLQHINLSPFSNVAENLWPPSPQFLAPGCKNTPQGSFEAYFFLMWALYWFMCPALEGLPIVKEGLCNWLKKERRSYNPSKSINLSKYSPDTTASRPCAWFKIPIPIYQHFLYSSCLVSAKNLRTLLNDFLSFARLHFPTLPSKNKEINMKNSTSVF